MTHARDLTLTVNPPREITTVIVPSTGNIYSFKDVWVFITMEEINEQLREKYEKENSSKKESQ